jgi:hypothetical protein
VRTTDVLPLVRVNGVMVSTYYPSREQLAIWCNVLQSKPFAMAESVVGPCWVGPEELTTSPSPPRSCRMEFLNNPTRVLFSPAGAGSARNLGGLRAAIETSPMPGKRVLLISTRALRRTWTRSARRESSYRARLQGCPASQPWLDEH